MTSRLSLRQLKKAAKIVATGLNNATNTYCRPNQNPNQNQLTTSKWILPHEDLSHYFKTYLPTSNLNSSVQHYKTQILMPSLTQIISKQFDHMIAIFPGNFFYISKCRVTDVVLRWKVCLSTTKKLLKSNTYRPFSVARSTCL